MARSNESYRLNYGASDYSPDGGSGVSFGGTGSGTYGVRVPIEGGGRFGIGLGSGAVGGGGKVLGANLRVPLGGNYKPETKAGVKPTDKNAKGGKIKAKKMAKGGSVSSGMLGMGRAGRAGRESDIRMVSKAKGGSVASKRADGCCTKGKTKGRMV